MKTYRADVSLLCGYKDDDDDDNDDDGGDDDDDEVACDDNKSVSYVYKATFVVSFFVRQTAWDRVSIWWWKLDGDDDGDDDDGDDDENLMMMMMMMKTWWWWWWWWKLGDENLMMKTYDFNCWSDVAGNLFYFKSIRWEDDLKMPHIISS